MKACPYCAEQIQDAAIKCRYCGSRVDLPLGRGRGGADWYRLREGKMIAGVCAGLADHFGVSVSAVRLAAVLLAFMGAGWGVLVYLVLWIVMPYRDSTVRGPGSATDHAP